MSLNIRKHEALILNTCLSDGHINNKLDCHNAENEDQSVVMATFNIIAAGYHCCDINCEKSFFKFEKYKSY